MRRKGGGGFGKLCVPLEKSWLRPCSIKCREAVKSIFILLKLYQNPAKRVEIKSQMMRKQRWKLSLWTESGAEEPNTMCTLLHLHNNAKSQNKCQQ